MVRQGHAGLPHAGKQPALTVNIQACQVYAQVCQIKIGSFEAAWDSTCMLRMRANPKV